MCVTRALWPTPSFSSDPHARQGALASHSNSWRDAGRRRPAPGWISRVQNGVPSFLNTIPLVGRLHAKRGWPSLHRKPGRKPRVAICGHVIAFVIHPPGDLPISQPSPRTSSHASFPARAIFVATADPSAPCLLRQPPSARPSPAGSRCVCARRRISRSPDSALRDTGSWPPAGHPRSSALERACRSVSSVALAPHARDVRE